MIPGITCHCSPESQARSATDRPSRLAAGSRRGARIRRKLAGADDRNRQMVGGTSIHQSALHVQECRDETIATAMKSSG